MEKEFQFVRSSQETVENQRSREVALTVVGSVEETEKKNHEALGALIAQRIAGEIQEAARHGKRLVLDMATGSTPEPVWDQLRILVTAGKVDLSSVIVIGHEEAWGSYEKGSHSDFDHYRREKFFHANGIAVHDITEENQLIGKEIDGNFMPMHLSEDPEKAARQYAALFEKLEKRDDVTFFGLYGVGTDGHIGEIQIGSQGVKAGIRKRHIYADPIQSYSLDSDNAQLFRWQDTSGGFRVEDNVFWTRGKGFDDISGRGAREGYGGMQTIVGLGWHEMLRQDKIMLALNGRKKQLAFKLAMEGSFTGDVVNDQGEQKLHIDQNKGEGEGIFTDLEKFAIELENAGILEHGVAERVRGGEEPLKVGMLFQEIYSALDGKSFDTDNTQQYYEWMWTFANRYLGSRSPVSQLIRMRSILGRETQIVATADVVQGTQYETLSK